MFMVSYVQYEGIHVEYWSLKCSEIGKKARMKKCSRNEPKSGFFADFRTFK